MSINYKINLRTRTKVCGFTDLSYFFMDLHLLIELYPLVPFPPSVDERVSAVTAEPLRWRTVTPARTCGLTVVVVPNVGCQNLRIPPDCSQTPGSVPIVAGPSSRRVPVMAGSTQLTTTIGTRYCAPQTADALKSSRYMFAAWSTRRVDASR